LISIVNKNPGIFFKYLKTPEQEFAESIDESFGMIFNQKSVMAEISYTSFIDPKEVNDLAELIVIPMSSPIVITEDATDVKKTEAVLNMFYNFKWVDSGEVRFAYTNNTKSLVDWLYTPWEARSGSGFYSRQVTGLSQATDYKFKAQLRYDSTEIDGVTVNVTGMSFTTNSNVSLVFDQIKGYEPSIIHISGDIYAVAYRGDDDNGLLITVRIADDGYITDTIIDTLSYDTEKGYEPSIIHISGDIYAVAYRGDHDDGLLKTLQIADDGDSKMLT